MKKLCVFYKDAEEWIGKRIDWIVCKECAKKLRDGERLQVGYNWCD